MPKLLDLFCGAGGAAMGYHRAGFEVVGVDIKPQPHFPFEFHQGDAMTYALEGFDAIHASPPCQGYSIMRNLPWLRHKVYPLLIEPTRERLVAADVPWVIENVAGARRTIRRPDGMQAGWLCGGMFGLPFYRHRYFETNWFWMQPGHPRHQVTIRGGRTLGGRARDIVFSAAEDSRGIETWPGRRGDHGAGHGLTIRPEIGHGKGIAAARAAMGVEWMRGDEITQAIPPAYTEYIGKWLMKALA